MPEHKTPCGRLPQLRGKGVQPTHWSSRMRGMFPKGYQEASRGQRSQHMPEERTCPPSTVFPLVTSSGLRKRLPLPTQSYVPDAILGHGGDFCPQGSVHPCVSPSRRQLLLSLYNCQPFQLQRIFDPKAFSPLRVLWD